MTNLNLLTKKIPFQRKTVLTELGKTVSMGFGHSFFEKIGSGYNLLFIGFGPDFSCLEQLIKLSHAHIEQELINSNYTLSEKISYPIIKKESNNLTQNIFFQKRTAEIIKNQKIAFLEAPLYLKQLKQQDRENIPITWLSLNEYPLKEYSQKISNYLNPSTSEFKNLEIWINKINEIGKINKLSKTQNLSVYFYKPGLKFFPSFYAPIKSYIQRYFFNCHKNYQGNYKKTQEKILINQDNCNSRKKIIVIPGTSNDLLIKELEHAFINLGYNILYLNSDTPVQGLYKITQEANILLYLSINFKGLDSYGENYHFLKQAGIKVAVWCVDNPWHLLSNLRSPFWKEVYFFVTDNYFIPSLIQYGATKVKHLPLASCPELFSQNKNDLLHTSLNPIVFVGRSAFPNRNKFFAAHSVEKNMLEKAMKNIEYGLRPDFDYWSRVFNIKKFWFNQDIRQIGLASELCSLNFRLINLIQASYFKLTLFGDADWQNIFKQALMNRKGFKTENIDLRPSVDYYTQLPNIYVNSSINLNLTSLLLPNGLNQRHFDIWLADGFCLTDKTPGLKLFPEDLCQEICFANPQELKMKIEGLLFADHKLIPHLKFAWKKLILKEHTYIKRLETLLMALGEE